MSTGETKGSDPADDGARRRRPKRRGRDEIPWDLVRAEYVGTAEATKRALIRRYRLDRKRFYERAQREKWDEERAAFLDELAHEIRERTVAIRADLAVDALRRLLDGTIGHALKVLAHAGRALAPTKTPPVQTIVESRVERDPNDAKKVIRRRVYRRAQRVSRADVEALRLAASLVTDLLGLDDREIRLGAGGDGDSIDDQVRRLQEAQAAMSADALGIRAYRPATNGQQNGANNGRE